MNPKFDNEANSSAAIDEQLKEPTHYRVILLNDDYTTKEFVTEILIDVFQKSHETAVLLMEKVHVAGSAEVGVYSYDIAITRVSLTLQSAREQGYPLQCKIEEC